jgi:Uma2 family endonuclease
MATASTTELPSHDPSITVPPLENGDQLTRAEFERRYSAMPNLKKAELIEGEVYMPSPVKFEQHAEQHAIFLWWLASFRVFTPVVRVGDNPTIRLDLDNDHQPDGVLFLDPSAGGKVRLEDDYVTGAPDLVGEIASSSVSIDLGRKFNVYRRNGVREYVVWRVLDHAVDWFVLRGPDFVRLAPGSDGIHRSEVFPRLWLDATALVAGDLIRVHQVLQQGLASAEHATFVAKLQ